MSNLNYPWYNIFLFLDTTSHFVKVGIIKEEAERQRLQREELEMELHNVKQQMLGVKSSDADVKRYASTVSELDRVSFNGF